MARYWVNLGHWDAGLMDDGSEESASLKRNYEEADGAMCGLANSVNKFSGYVYKTNHKEDAEEGRKRQGKP